MITTAGDAAAALGRSTLAKVGLAPLAVPAAALRRRVARPRQHRLRGAADEAPISASATPSSASAPASSSRLRAVRGAEQPDPRARRRAALDRAHHDHVGHACRSRMMFVQGADQLLRAALSCSASRRPAFLPGIIYYLGNWYPAKDRARAVSWFMLAIPLSTVIGAAARGLHSRARRLARAHRLAVAVLARRRSGHRSRLRRARVSDGFARQGGMARARRAALAHGARARRAASRAESARRRHRRTALLHPTVWLLGADHVRVPNRQLRA